MFIIYIYNLVQVPKQLYLDLNLFNLHTLTVGKKRKKRRRRRKRKKKEKEKKITEENIKKKLTSGGASSSIHALPGSVFIPGKVAV